MKALPLLLCALANVIGGLSYLWQKLALAGLPPATVILLRNLIALACMGGWLVATTGVRWRYPRRDLLRLALVGVLAYALPLLLGIVGVAWSTATNGSLLILLEPPSILLFAWLLLGERLRSVQVAGVAFGLLGALCIVTDGANWDELVAGLAASGHVAGNALLAIHGVLWGLYSPLMRPLAQQYPALQVTFMSMLLGLLLLVPASLAEGPRWTAGPELGSALAYTVVLGLLVSFAGTLLWNWSLARIPASVVAGFVFLQPLVGVFAGGLFLGERLSAAALAGAGLIAAGVLLVVVPGARSGQPA